MIRKVSILTMLVIISMPILLSGCNKKETDTSYHLFSSEGLLAAKLDGKWGYLNRKGDVAIPFEFEEAHPFFQGYAHVVDEGLHYLIDSGGQSVFVEGYADLKKDGNRYWFVYNERLGLMSHEGTILANPVYDVLKDPEGRYAFFKDNLARVSVNGKFSFIDETGDVVLNAAPYQAIDHFTSGYARVMQNQRYGVVNKQGELVIPIQYEQLSEPDQNGFVIGRQRIDEPLLQLISVKHEVIAEGSEVILFNNEIYAVFSNTAQDGHLDVYDRHGNLLKAYEYPEGVDDFISSLRFPINHLYAMRMTIEDESMTGLMINNAQNELVFHIRVNEIDNTMHFIFDDQEHLYFVRQIRYGQYHLKEIYIDSGSEVVKVLHDDISQMFKTWIVAIDEGQYGVVDHKRQIVIPFIYDSLTIFNDYVIVEKQGKFGLLDMRGNVVLPIIYEGIVPADLTPPTGKISSYDLFDYLEGF